MQIIIIGDIHGNFPVLDTILNSTNADIYLQIGDLAGNIDNPKLRYPDLCKPVIFISGNHEDMDILEPYNLKETYNSFQVIGHNLWYLPMGNVISYKGITIAGLGGNYSPNRFFTKRKSLAGRRRCHYTFEPYQRLYNFTQHIDILLTHEAPSPFIMHGKDYGRQEIGRLIQHLNPTYHFHGHHHIYNCQRIKNTISKCIPIKSFIEMEI